MQEIILYAVFGIFILSSFIIGFNLGKGKNEEKNKIEVKKKREPIISKIIGKKDDEVLSLNETDVIEWENINNFDGTIGSQKNYKEE